MPSKEPTSQTKPPSFKDVFSSEIGKDKVMGVHEKGRLIL